MGGRIKGYAGKASPEMLTRLIAVVPREEADKIDAWGGAAGMPSRTATIRFLLKKGLETVGTTAMSNVLTSFTAAAARDPHKRQKIEGGGNG